MQLINFDNNNNKKKHYCLGYKLDNIGYTQKQLWNKTIHKRDVG